MLAIHDLHIAFGETDLLSIEHWEIHPTQKIALVGHNGCGKSSLLKVLVGEEHPRDGRRTTRNNLRLGYLPQRAVSGSTRSVWEEVKSGMTRILELEAHLNECEQNADTESGQIALIEAMDAYRLAGGYNQEERIGSTLHGLGFAREDWSKGCDTFSGGWQMRIALAKLLLSDPDLAILDEPTNHLDTPTKEWLAHHLNSVQYAILVVSHDHPFLDAFASHIVEIRSKQLHRYTGNYTQFLRQRDERMMHEQLAYERNVAKAAHLQSYIDRFGAKATKAKQAQSRKKQLAKIDLSGAPDQEIRRSTLRFHEATASDFIPFELRNANVGWPEQPSLFNNVNLILERGMKMVIVGPNGCGKSSLMKTLAGDLQLHAGQRRVGERIRLGIYAQDLAQHLPLDQHPVQYIHDRCPTIGETEIRKVLGALGLQSDSHTREIGKLSGGEKSRVVLAELSLNQYNVLFLDEPTNHLDTASAEAVATALQNFEGPVLSISHDANFIEQVATHVVRCVGDQIEVHAGFRPDLLEIVETTTHSVVKSAAADDHKARKKRRNQRRKLEREYQDLEENIETLEGSIEQMDADMFTVGTDLTKLKELTDQKIQAESDLEAMMERWEELAELLEEMGDEES